MVFTELFEGFSKLLDPVFGPLLGLDPLLAIALLSFLISLIITLIYKFTTDQDLMKRLKSELKELQKQIKELKDNPDAMMKVQREMMQTNGKYMMQSMKSTLYTILPVILIFTWMSANFAYDPIGPDEQFQIDLLFKEGVAGEVSVQTPVGIEVIGDEMVEIADNIASFSFKGEAGSYTESESIKFTYDEGSAFKDVIISSGTEYAPMVESVRDDSLQSITINYDKKRILPGLGWGWLGTYIVFSIIFSILLRKLMKVY